MEWYHVCWPRLTAKRVEPVVSISWASCFLLSCIIVCYYYSCLWHVSGIVLLPDIWSKYTQYDIQNVVCCLATARLSRSRNIDKRRSRGRHKTTDHICFVVWPTRMKYIIDENLPRAVLITRATLCVSAVFAVVACPSVCLSHAGIVSKRLNLF